MLGWMVKNFTSFGDVMDVQYAETARGIKVIVTAAAAAAAAAAASVHTILF